MAKKGTVLPDPSFLDPDLSAEARYLGAVALVLSADGLIRATGLDKIISTDVDVALDLGVSFNLGAIAALPAEYIPGAGKVFSLLDKLPGPSFEEFTGIDIPGFPTLAAKTNNDAEDVMMSGLVKVPYRDVMMAALTMGYIIEKSTPVATAAITAAGPAIEGVGAAVAGFVPG